MKSIIIPFLFISALLSAQEFNSSTWEEQSKTNIRLLPKYGDAKKTKAQKELDKKFIDQTMSQDEFKDNPRAASNHLIDLGFKYIYRNDLKTAMYRFNQAYLLDKNNPEIYWGYGAFFMSLGYYSKAKEQYENGLIIAPKNPHLLTDYGTFFMAQFSTLSEFNPELASSQLDSAKVYLMKSLEADDTDMNTLYKLSIVNLNSGDCKAAEKYLQNCQKLGGDPITDSFLEYFKSKCN